jgi:hypothetical protein
MQLSPSGGTKKYAALVELQPPDQRSLFALSPDEAGRLTECEDAIVRGNVAFGEVGDALGG